ncbi:MAG: Hsp20/alpha crystallin family protein [Monoglobales bacterium]|jgi:HSP20 family protein
MLVPSIFGRDMFDDFFGNSLSNYRTNDLMKTDIKDTDNAYELTIDMPGIKKEDIKAELKDGYLTVNATSGYSNDDKDSNGKYIRRERHYGSCSRSFYVGNAVTQDDIKASFENGTLKLVIPKKEDKPAIENKNYIRIE